MTCLQISQLSSVCNRIPAPTHVTVLLCHLSQLKLQTQGKGEVSPFLKGQSLPCCSAAACVTFSQNFIFINEQTFQPIVMNKIPINPGRQQPPHLSMAKGQGKPLYTVLPLPVTSKAKAYQIFFPGQCRPGSVCPRLARVFTPLTVCFCFHSSISL